jgi:hypothetical protein
MIGCEPTNDFFPGRSRRRHYSLMNDPLLMTNEQPKSKGIYRWMVAGAIGGGLFLAFDGAILGAVLGSLEEKGGRPLAWALSWAVYLGLAGALLGAAIGGLARHFGPRMVLPPPNKEKDIA